MITSAAASSINSSFSLNGSGKLFESGKESKIGTCERNPKVSKRSTIHSHKSLFRNSDLHYLYFSSDGFFPAINSFPRFPGLSDVARGRNVSFRHSNVFRNGTRKYPFYSEREVEI